MAAETTAPDTNRKEKPVSDLPPLAYRIPEAQHLLGGVGRSTIYDLFGSGELTAIKLNRITLVLAAELHALLERKLQASKVPATALSAQMSKVRRHQKARPARLAA